jgi:glutathione synthase
MDFLFVMDPVESMLPDKDTTFAFMRGARARGHRCWFCLPHQVSTRLQEVCCQATEVWVSDAAPYVTSGHSRELELSAVDAIFIRKDPPFDAQYLYLTQQLELVCNTTLVINSPRGLRDANEKLFALHFGAYVPRTVVTSSPARMLEFLDEIGGTGVLKPLDGAGGFGVVLLRKDDSNLRALIDMLTLEGRRLALLQEFLPAVKEGDKRVLLLDGELLGVIRRVPYGNDIRANIHVGGTVEPTELTSVEHDLVRHVGQELRRRGLWFVGLDLVGERLIEVNVTSPTGLQQLGRHLGRPIEQEVIAWAEVRSERVKATRAVNVRK